MNQTSLLEREAHVDSANSSKPGSPQEFARVDWSAALLKPALLVWAIVFVWLSWFRVYSPDEYEALHQGWLLFVGRIQYNDFNSNHPPLLFQTMRMLHYLSHDAVTLLHLARGIALVASVASLAFLYRITNSVYGARAARWAVILYAVNATLWEWAIEIRTDTLLVPLWLAAVSLVVDQRRLSLFRILGVGLLMGTAFWVNQKAILHSVPLGLYMIFGGPNRQWKLKSVLLAVAASAIPAALVLGHSVCLGSLEALFENNFVGGAEHVKANPFRIFRLYTIMSVFRYDFGMVALSLVSLAWTIVRIRQSSRSQRFVLVASIWMAATYFWIPGPFGYYMMSVFPLILVGIAGWLQHQNWLADRRQNRMLVTLLAISFGLFPIGWLTKFAAPSNAYQAQSIRLGSQLTDENSCVFDFSGAICNRPHAYRFFTRLSHDERPRFEDLLPSLVPSLKAKRCDLMVRTDRTRNVKPIEDREIIEHHFVKLWGPLYVPGYDSIETVAGDSLEIELWYDGVYETKTPGLMIDGKPFEDRMELDSGTHTITLAESGQRIQILDSNYRSRVTLPSTDEDEQRFLYKHWIFR